MRDVRMSVYTDTNLGELLPCWLFKRNKEWFILKQPETNVYCMYYLLNKWMFAEESYIFFLFFLTSRSRSVYGFKLWNPYWRIRNVFSFHIEATRNKWILHVISELMNIFAGVGCTVFLLFLHHLIWHLDLSGYMRIQIVESCGRK